MKRKISLALIVLAILAILVAIWIGVRSIVDWGEGLWSCKSGAWVKNSSSSASKLDWECGNRMAAILESEAIFKNSKPNFSKTGNLICKNLNCLFVYEDAGMPALTVGLTDSSASKCIVNSVDVSCASARWNMGDRAIVLGFLAGRTVTISKMNVLTARVPN